MERRLNNTESEFWGTQALAHLYQTNPKLMDPNSTESFRRRLDLIKIARDALFTESLESMNAEQLEDHKRRLEKLQAIVDELGEEMGIEVTLDVPTPPPGVVTSDATTEDFLLGQSNAKAMLVFSGDEDDPWEGNRRLGRAP